MYKELSSLDAKCVGNIIKKDGTLQGLDLNKIINAVNKSAERVMIKFNDEEIEKIKNLSLNYITKYYNENETISIPIENIHIIVENVLKEINKDVCKSYRDYRNYKTEFVKILDKVYNKSEELRYLADKSNGNTDSTLVSTKRSITYKYLSKELYQKFNLNEKEREAIEDGYIYIHDIGDRRDTINCCIFDMQSVLTGGFEMSNIWYNEPNSLDTAFDVISDVVLNAASQQYGEI